MLARGWGLNESDFLKLWNYFQENALSRLDKAAQREVPVIVWTSGLTNVPYLQQYLDKNRYIIQVNCLSLVNTEWFSQKNLFIDLDMDKSR